MQIVDSAFPTGAFAHSFGLETYVQNGAVHDSSSFAEFLAANLRHGVGACDAVAACVAHRAVTAGDHDALFEADELLAAMKLPEETRRAGETLGKRLLATCDAVFDEPAIGELRERFAVRGAASQHAVVFGAVASVLRVERQPACAAYLHSHAMAQASAAVRLVPLGGTEAQRVVRSLHGAIDELAGRAAGSGIEDMSSFIPGLDIASMRHAGLTARLFMS